MFVLINNSKKCVSIKLIMVRASTFYNLLRSPNLFVQKHSFYSDVRLVEWGLLKNGCIIEFIVSSPMYIMMTNSGVFEREHFALIHSKLWGRTSALYHFIRQPFLIWRPKRRTHLQKIIFQIYCSHIFFLLYTTIITYIEPWLGGTLGLHLLVFATEGRTLSLAAGRPTVLVGGHWLLRG